MTNKKALALVAAGSLLCCSGCMSPLAIGVRVERLNHPTACDHHLELYPATRLDCDLLFHEYWAGGDWNLAADFWFLAPLTLLDIPLAILTDTLSLPCDIYYSTRTNAANQASEAIGAEAAPQHETGRSASDWGDKTPW